MNQVIPIKPAVQTAMSDALTLALLREKIETEAVQAAAPAPPGARLAGLLALSQQVRAATEQPVTFRQAFLWQDGEPLLWPNTVNLVLGQTGSHKSRLAELISSAIIAKDALRGDTLGVEFRPAMGEKYRTLYVDTERNLSDQLPYAIQCLKGRAGYGFTEHPAELDYTSLVMLPRTERFPALVEFLAHHRAGFEGHLIVVLDVLSDCVADFNDVAASLQLMDMLNVAVNEQNATILAVIHENPGTGSSKARGHLGTEATNKASTVLQIGYVKEGGKATPLIQIACLKRRYGAPGHTFYATFDESTKGLVRANYEVPEGSARPGRQRATPVTEILLLLTEFLGSAPLSAGQLEQTLADRLTVSARTARKYLSELLEPGAAYVLNAEKQPCRLTNEKAPSGPGKVYSLAPLTPVS